MKKRYRIIKQEQKNYNSTLKKVLREYKWAIQRKKWWPIGWDTMGDWGPDWYNTEGEAEVALKNIIDMDKPNGHIQIVKEIAVKPKKKYA